MTLMKRVADLTDPNPVKLAFGVAKAIIEIREVRAAKSVRLIWIMFNVVLDRK